MIHKKKPQCELQYRPQAGKTLRAVLSEFIAREFPRLGGPWIINLFVDKLLRWIEAYRIEEKRLLPGQTLWSAVAIEARHRRGQTMSQTRQVPVVLTIADQEQVAELRAGKQRTEVLKRALVRAAFEAYGQGGVLSTTDLAMLFHRPYKKVAQLICAHEQETGQVVPRRGNIHDIGRTLTHKRIICRKAYLEGKTTLIIARETCHSAVAVDRYILDFSRIYFAHVERGMSFEEVVFSVQMPRYLVVEYLGMIQEFGLAKEQIYERSGVAMQLTNKPDVT